MRQAVPATPSANAQFWRAAPFVFVLFWSGGYSFAKLGLAHAEPMTLLAMRYGLAVVALAPFLLRRGIDWPHNRRHWAALAFTGFLIQCVYFGLAYLAMKRGMNASTAAIIMALQPMLVATLAPLAGVGRPERWVWPGLALGFLGVLLVILAGDSLGPSPAVAVLLAFAALCGITGATLFEKWHGTRTDPAVGGIVQYMVGFAVLMPVAAATESLSVDWHPELVIALAYLVVANSIISVGLYIALLQRGDATRISALLYLVPPLALFVAWVILGETMTALSLAGFALCVLGVYIVHRKTT